MKVGLTSLDRLVVLVQDSGGSVPVAVAARELFSLARPSDPPSLQLLRPIVDGDARLTLSGGCVVLADRRDPPLETATFVVLDLETTGLPTAGSRISEIGAVRISELSIAERFEVLVDLEAGVALGAGVPRAAGAQVPVEEALRRLTAFAGDAVLVAHNARFDVGFIDLELRRATGHRLAATVVDTLPLARRLLRGRIERTSLAALAFFFGVSVEPCHRALPDAEATAEVFLRLVDLARAQGAAMLSELEALATPAAPRRRRPR